jgi:hypothetical protein
MAVPGLTPIFPVMRVGPVLVTVAAPKTAKLCAEPSGGTVCAGIELPVVNRRVINKIGFTWRFSLDRLDGYLARHCREGMFERAHI